MANNIDERIVEMQFDNKQFESGVKETIKSLDDLKKGLKLEDVTDGFTKLDKAASNINLNPLTNGVEAISQKFSALEVIAVSALARITNQAMATGERLIKSFTVDPIADGWTKYESKVAAVQKIMNSSADMEMTEVEAILNKIEWFTNETSYEFDAMVQTLGSFTAAGVPLEKAADTIIGLANAAAISGVNAKDASHAFLGFQRAIGSGSLSLGVWNSFLKTAGFQSQAFIEGCIKAGLEVGTLTGSLEDATIKGTKTKVTLSNFAETLKKKWVDTDVINTMARNFSVATNQLYEVTQIDKNSPLYGAMSTTAIEAMGDALDEYSKRAFEAGQETKTWGDTVQYIRESVTQGWSKTWELIFGNYEEATEFFSIIVEDLGELFVSAGDKRNTFLQGWKDAGGRDSFINGLINAIRILNTVIGNAKGAFSRVIPPVAVESAVALTKSFETLMATLAKAMGVETIAGVFEEEIDTLKDGLNETAEAGENVAETLKTVAEMASLVIRGDFGNGQVRRDKLTELGYSYELIQNKVNEILGCSFRYNSSLVDTTKLTGEAADASGDLADSMENSADVVVDVYNAFTNLSSTFRGVVAIAELISYAIGSVVRVASRVIKYIFKLSEGVLGITGTIGDLIVSFKDFIIENDVIYLSLSKLADLIGTVLTPVITVFNKIMDALSSRTNPFLGFINSFTDAITGLGEIDFSKSFDEIFATIFERFGEFGTKVTDTISNISSFISESQLLQDIINGISSVFGIASTSVQNFWNSLKDLPSNIISGIETFYNNTKTWVTGLKLPKINLDLNTYINNIKDFGKNSLLIPVANAFSMVIGKISEFGTTLANNGSFILTFARDNGILKTALGALLVPIMAIPFGIYKLWDVVKQAPIGIFNSVSNFFSQIRERIKDLKLPDVKEQFKGMWGSLSEGFRTSVLPRLSSGLQAASKSISDFIVNVVKGASSVADFVRENNLFELAITAIQPILNRFSTTLTKIWDSLKNTVPSVISKIKEGFGVFKNWFNTYQLGRLQWSFDDFWRSFLPADSLLVKLNDFKRDGIAGLFQGIGVFKDSGRAVVAYYNAVMEAVKDYAKDNRFLQYMANAFENIKTRLMVLFEYVRGIVSPTLERIKIALGPVIDKIVEVRDKLLGLDYGSIIKYVAIFAGIFAAFKALQIINNVSSFLGGLGAIGDGINSFFTAIKIRAVGAVALSLAAAIGIVAGVFYLLSKLEWDQIYRGIATMVTVTLLLGIVFGTFAAIAKADPKSIAAAAGSLAAIGLAIGAAVAALYFLSNMGDTAYWTGLVRIIALIGVLVLGMIGISMAMKGRTIDPKSMAGLFLFAMTLSKVVTLIEEVADMPWQSIGKGLTVLLGVVILISTMAGTIGGLKFGNTVSLVVMAGALWLFVQVIKYIAGQDFGKLTMGLLKMLPLIAALKLITKAGEGLGKDHGGLAIAATLIAFAISIKMIVNAIKVLGRMPITELVTGGAAVVGILIALVTAIHFMTKSLSTVKIFGKANVGMALSIVAFAGALYIISQAMIELSKVKDPWKLVPAAIAIGIVMYTLGQALRLAIDPYKSGGTAKILAFALIIVILVGALAILQTLDWKKLAVSAASLAACLASVGLGLMALKAVPWKTAAAAVVGLVIVLAAIVAGLKFLAMEDPNRLLAAAKSIVEVVVVVGGICGALASFKIDPGAMMNAGIGIGAAFDAIVLVVGGLAAVAAAIVGKGNLLNGMDGLIKFFEKLGEMFGKFAGGTVLGYADGLGDAGEKLSKFANSAKDFADIFGKTKWSKLVSNMNDFARCLKTLNSEKPDPTNFDNYSTILTRLADGVSAMMTVLQDASFDFTNFSALATALPQIIDVVQDPETAVDDAQWDAFSTSLTKFGKAFVDFNDEIAGANLDMGALANIVTGVRRLASIAETIKGIGSFDGFDSLFGEVDENGESSLTRMAQQMVKFYKIINPITGEGGTGVDIDKMLDSFEAIRRLAVAAKNVPIDDVKNAALSFGGTKSVDGFGDTLPFSFGFDANKSFSWDTLSTGLTELATAMVTFSTTANGIDDAGLEKGLSAVSSLSTMANELPVSFQSTLSKLYVDDNTMSGFATALTQLGESLVTYSDLVSPLDDTALTPTNKFIDKILGIPGKFQRAGITNDDGGTGVSLATWGSNFVTFAERLVEAINILNDAATALGTTEDGGSVLANSFNSLIDSLMLAFTEENLDMIARAGIEIGAKLAEGINSDPSVAPQAITEWINLLAEAALRSGNVETLKVTGEQLSQNIASGIQDDTSVTALDAAADKIAREVYTVFHSKEVYDLYFQSGQFIVDGLVKGMGSKSGDVKAAAEKLATNANTSFKQKEESNSPSKVWIRFGSYLVDGLVLGIENSTESAVRSAAYLADRLNGSFDSNVIAPKISPVVDLNNASISANRINTMFDANRAAALSASMDINSQITQMDDLVTMTSQILGTIQNGSDVYLDGKVITGYVNRRLGQA